MTLLKDCSLLLRVMKTETIEQPFEVRLIEAREWKQAVHNHNFFEIVSIIGGRACISSMVYLLIIAVRTCSS